MRARSTQNRALSLSRSLFLLLALGTACGEPQTAPPPPPIAAPVPPPPPPAPERAGPTCTYHGICWASPLPQGNTLRAVRAIARDSVIAVGDRGTILRWDGRTWALEDAPSRERLHDVWAGATGVLAVGDRGTLLRRGEDGSWTAIPSGTESALRAIAGGGTSDAWAVGDDGTILRVSGATATREPMPAGVPGDASIVDVAGDGAGALYALAIHTAASGDRARTLMSRTADGWSALPAPAGDVSSVWVDPSGALVLGGDQAGHGDGTSWRRRSFGVDRPLDVIWGAAADDAWAAGYEGRLSQWDGSRWREATLGTTLDVLALSGTSASDVWAVGEHGLVAHYDGEAWAIVSSGPTARLEGVHGLSAHDVWAVGDHVSLHWDGSTWSVAGPDDVELEALSGSGDVLVAVGVDGAIRRWRRGLWSSEPTGTSAKLAGVWLRDPSHAIAVGGDGWVEQDEATWHPVAERPAATAIWGASASDVWAVGADGISHYDGRAWSAVAGTAGDALFGVWGRAASDVYAVGAGGRVLHWDGAAWSAAAVPTTQDLLGVWGRAQDDVWAVGHHGTIVHWDGRTWSWRDSGTDELLHAVWGAEGGDVWIVGHGGAILRAAGALAP